MPTLKQITCSLELGPARAKLKEYDHRYTDGGVEAFIAVPETDLPFQIRVVSSGYIASGLAAYVFIDGRYQCNRNRQKLSVPTVGTNPCDYEVDFCFRQLEEKTSHGYFIGRDWSFAKLKTDDATNIHSNFAQNVGAIEVVILRCKDADLMMSASDHPSYIAPTSRLPSVLAKTSGALPTTKRVPEAGTKPFSKPPSKAASSKKALAIGDDTMGGMFGLFDGAGDEPTYYRHVPSCVVDQTPLPGYRWNTRNGTYRFHYSDDPFVERRNKVSADDRSKAPYERDRYQSRPPAVPGGRNLDHRTTPNLSSTHLGAAAGRNTPPFPLPQGHYNSQQRHRIPSVLPGGSQRHSVYSRKGDQETQEGFLFVLDVCKQIEKIYRLAYNERKKAESLHQESQAYCNDPDLRLAAIRSLRLKEAEIQNYDQEAAALLSAIFSRMRRMDRDTWHDTRDFLVVELRLVTPGHPELREWQDPRLRQYEPPAPIRHSERTNGQHDEAWHELGQCVAGGSLWETKQKEYEQAARLHGLAECNNNEEQQQQQQHQIDELGKHDICPSPEAIKKFPKANDGLGGGVRQNNRGSENLGNGNDQGNEARDQINDQNGFGGQVSDNNNQQSKSASNWVAEWGDSKQDTTWTADDGAPQGSSKSQQNGGCADRSEQQSDQSKKSEKGGLNNDAQSRSHGSSVKIWNDEGDKSNGKVQNWDEPEGELRGKSGGNEGGSTTRHEPVIKPYWADWNKPHASSGKLSSRARDVYEYPAPARPTLSSGKMTDVSYGVAAGRGANYAHKMFRPEYLDTMEKPYAIFTFKYRSKVALEKILNRKVDTSGVQHAIEEAEKERLRRMPKDELVEQMMKMKLAAAPSPAALNKEPMVKPVSISWGTADGNGRAEDRWVGDNGTISKGAQDNNNNNSDDPWGAAGNNNGSNGWSGEDTSFSRGNDAWDNKQDHQKQLKSASKSNGGGGNGGGAWLGDNAGGAETPNHFEGDKDLKTADAKSQIWW